MRIAVSIFNERVSPRFDSAIEMILVDAVNGKVSERTRLSTMELSCSEKIERLMDLKIDALLCGGIDNKCKESLISYGIQVHPWLNGDTETLLNEYLVNYKYS